jgi:hypothetical protein
MEYNPRCANGSGARARVETFTKPGKLSLPERAANL